MSPYALHGSREGSTNLHKLGRFVNAPMAFYILTPFIFVLELISLMFSFVFRLFCFILRLPSIVCSFSILKKGRRWYVPTSRGSLGTLGPYRFRLFIRCHSRSIRQRHYNGNSLHVFYAHRANAGGPFSFPPPHVLRRTSSLPRESKRKNATPFVCVPRRTNPYVHLQVKLSDGSMPWMKVKVSDTCGEMH